MYNSIKKLTLGALTLGAISLTGCMSSGSNIAGPGEEGYATIYVQAKTSNVNRLSKPGLGKSSVIELENLIVRAISNASTPDTVTVTLEVGDSGFASSASTDQSIALEMSLKALRSWTLYSYTVDVNDSVIQYDSVVVGNLFAGQTKLVTINPKPLWTMYNATFNFPDSIFSPTGLFGQKVNITKIELWIDTVLVDSETDSFEPDTNYVLAYDYVAPSADSVALVVYGNIDSASAPYNSGNNILYSKTVSIASLVETYPTPNSVPLVWKGPTGGVLDITVDIDKVGIVAIEGVTEPEVLD